MNSSKAIRQQLKEKGISVAMLGILAGYGGDPSYANSQLRSGQLSSSLKEALDKLCIKY